METPSTIQTGGSIELVCGCMFSGKTTELIRRIRDAQHHGADVIALKPTIDNRYSETHIVSHNGDTLESHTVDSARDIPSAAKTADVVALDEIHFFDDSIVEICQQLRDRGQRVITCGLDRDMWGDVFTHLERLSRIAQTTVLYGRCAVCGNRADRTHRKVPLLDDNLVGGPAEFEPRCERCFSPPNRPKPGRTVRGLAGPMSS